jgi:chromate transporter
MAAVSAGLIAGTAWKLAGALRSNPMGPRVCAALGAASFALVAWLRLPLIWVLASLGVIGIALAWRALRAADTARRGAAP